MRIPHVFIIITGMPCSTTYIPYSSVIIPVCLEPDYILDFAHSTALFSISLQLIPTYIIPYYWFMAKRDYKEFSSQVLS